jgi:hypothetical protein
MNLYTTQIAAVDPLTGKLCFWCGPNVPGVSFQDAEAYCQRNGLGYCKVHGLLVAEIDEHIPTNRIDYDIIISN